jgi:Family of unknown function (DUF6282)
MTASDLVRGAVDLYTHANPDLLPRRTDDLGLARESAEAGVAAVVHRHHYSSTADRARIAQDVTGFPLLGAILLNDSHGGMNPSAVDLALRTGAVWVGLPTLSAAAFRQQTGWQSNQFAEALAFGPGAITVADEAGRLRPETLDVLSLVWDADVALNLGYVSNAEQLAVARACAEHGHTKMVITNSRLSEDELAEAVTIPGLFFEITAYGIHPEGLGAGRSQAALEHNVEFIRRLGLERVVLASDGGMIGAPAPATILAWALDEYEARGFTLDELRTLTHENPRRLVPVP